MTTIRVSVVAAAFVYACLMGAPVAAQETEEFVIRPDSPVLAEAAPRSAAELEDLHNRLLEKRERFASEALAALGGLEADLAGRPGVPETTTGGAAQGTAEAASTFRITQNRRNKLAEAVANSTLAEPAAVNYRGRVLYAGNFSHIEASTNHGANFTSQAFPAGPADAPTVCCDNDMVIDYKTGVAFVSTLYVNSALTNGVIRIFVKKKLRPDLDRCYYTIDPAGASNDILPDYPHIALSRGNLFLSINAIPTSGTGFARMYRFNLSQMRNCQTTSASSFTQSHSSGQRVWVPAEGANREARMYWMQHQDSDTIRIFRWLDSSNSINAYDRNVSASSFTNPDCRGGIGNFDFIERSTAFSIAGFRSRCTVARGSRQATGLLACCWNSAPTGGINQAHVRAAVFRFTNLALKAEPHIYNQDFCFGYPVVTGNSLGDIGLSIAAGGRAGGGGTAARGFVGIDDKYTPGLGFFETVYRVANGEANRSDGRFGDYFTIHPYQPCTRWFGATSYAWNSSPVDAANDVNARWVEFGREVNIDCYNNSK